MYSIIIYIHVIGRKPAHMQELYLRQGLYIMMNIFAYTFMLFLVLSLWGLFVFLLPQC